MKSNKILILILLLAIVAASGCAAKTKQGTTGTQDTMPPLPVQNITPPPVQNITPPPTQEQETIVQPTGKLSIDYYTYTNLPVLTDKQITDKYCKMTSSEKEKYYQEKNLEAKELSDQLEDYIREWYAGRAPAKLPEGLLPPSMDHEKTRDWTLLRPEEVVPEKQWYFRAANEIPEDFSKLYFLGPDNHVTYMKLIFVAPLDSQLLVEGDFPHARFMDYQILEPFDPENPTTSGMGAPEVPIVDADINPDPGHTNPFRPNANRNAVNRHYHITFDLKAGNAVELNPEAMKAPEYRADGNTRVGGPFAFSGPIGDGQIIASVLWLRYYAPDKDAGPLGGVAIPKALLRLKTGETFWLQPDFSMVEERQLLTVQGYSTPPTELKFMGPDMGWFKMFGFWRTIADAIAYPITQPWGLLPKSVSESIINSRDGCYFARGQAESPPGNYETSASGLNYNTYIFRPVSLGANKVIALTGKLPKTPKTINGDSIFTTGEARYWSICHTGEGKDKKYPSLLYGCLMDEEVLTDSDSRYIIAYSRGNERPSNAKEECGVTWQDFGPESVQVLNNRWMSVMPEWYLPQYAPHQDNIPWETGEWSSANWDQTIMSYNNQDGFLGEYQPLVHYLSNQQFEDLGCPVDPTGIPEWE